MDTLAPNSKLAITSPSLAAAAAAFLFLLPCMIFTGKILGLFFIFEIFFFLKELERERERERRKRASERKSE